MAKFSSICYALLSILLLAQIAVSVDSPANSPTPPPESGSDHPAPISPTPISAPPHLSPVNPPSGSPPAPSPPDLAPASVPTPSTAPSSSPSPPPSEPSDVNHSNVSIGDESDGESRDGMNGGQKFGIAVGVIAAVVLVGFGGVVYKKRRENVRRSRYGYAARRDIL